MKTSKALRPFIYVSDTHLRAHNPRAWKISYKNELFKHLEWIADYAITIGACAVVFGGDLGDDPDWKISVLNRFSALFRDRPYVVMTAIGNHDVDNKNLQHYTDTALHNLHKNGIVDIPASGYPTIVDDWRFTFFHADTPEALALMQGNWVPRIPRDPNIHEVAIAHIPVGNVANRTTRDVRTLLVPHYDILCVADIHQQMPPHKLHSGCIVINPGPLERKTRSERNEFPSIAVVKSPTDITYVRVPTALPVEDVFNPAFLADDSSIFDDELGEDFLQKLEDMKVDEDCTEEELVQKLVTDLGQPPEVLEFILERLK